ncbi:Sodium channel modifier 1 [Zootermopsis nevadensis]|uniref:Sodium channel modifier 1 n=2 Tax=Zootermopsis nevadensis TaxID=136037 RepID=A0A067R9G4_ZOONE|nr:Sodium channel modifier 1 [Zootermopsis nevadensis]
MSFKRDGDDLNLLRSLKHRRVCELLSSHIPDDEAMLLKNGRLTCMICTHRPIFDTLSMLAIHRKGKKHVSELSKYLLHKRELDTKKLKSEQRRYLCTGLVESMGHRALSGEAQGNKLLITQVAYSSCSKQRLGLQRKPILDIENISKETEIPGVATKNNVFPSASAQVRQYLKGLWKKKPLEKTVEKCRENYGEGWAKSLNNVVDISLPDCPESILEDTATSSRPCSEEDVARKKKADHELKLKMSGWIKNADGKWVQDPDVEFDSDEHEPPKSSD